MVDFEGLNGVADEPDPLSVQLREKFREALKGKLKTRECEGCPLFSKEVIDFLIDQLVDAIHRMDKASQTMEDFIKLFNELEIALFKEKMRGSD